MQLNIYCNLMRYHSEQMTEIKSIRDPLGDTILIPANLYSIEGCRSYSEIKKVITSPAFVIQVGKEELYFFRLIDWELNILVEAKAGDSGFMVESCIQNPTTEYISSLLKKGALISFQ